MRGFPHSAGRHARVILDGCAACSCVAEGRVNEEDEVLVVKGKAGETGRTKMKCKSCLGCDH